MTGLAWIIAFGSVFASQAFVVPRVNTLTTRQWSTALASDTITFMSSDFVETEVSAVDEYDDEEENKNVGLISFEDLGLCREALSAIRAHPDWKTPTPIQQLAIPRLLVSSSSSDDEEDEIFDSVWCEAPTGSGKTAAYALPLLDNILQQRRRRRRSAGPQRKSRRGRKDGEDRDSSTEFAGDIVKSLVLCPTRELAIQIGSVLSHLASKMSPRRKPEQAGDRQDSNNKDRNNKVWNIQVIHGGVRLEPQISALATCINDGTEIDVLVATPGRLADIMTFYTPNRRKQEEDEDPESDLSSSEAALERRLLDALDATGRKDASLSLSQIQGLQLDRTDDDGRELLRNLLSNVEYLVLDEADRLLGRAFENEMNALLGLVKSQEQVKTWLFSATFPKQMEPRIDHVLKMMGGPAWKPPLRISCSQSDRLLQEEISSQLQKRLDRVAAKTNATGTTSTTPQLQRVGPASTIKLRTIRLDKRDRTQALRRLLETETGWDRVLVFVGTRYSSEHVATKLRRVGIESAELHGKLDQEARLRRLSDFKKGKIRVLLATDVASRGLDVVGLPAVVNYDLPRSTADFTHRVGRTGRAGRQGVAITFVTPESEPHLDLIERRHLPKPVEREILVGFEPDEEEWQVRSEAARMETPGVEHSSMGLAHDRMFGGIKGRRKSKKDRVREQIVRDQKQPSP